MKRMGISLQLPAFNPSATHLLRRISSLAKLSRGSSTSHSQKTTAFPGRSGACRNQAAGWQLKVSQPFREGGGASSLPELRRLKTALLRARCYSSGLSSLEFNLHGRQLPTASEKQIKVQKLWHYLLEVASRWAPSRSRCWCRRFLHCQPGCT